MATEPPQALDAIWSERLVLVEETQELLGRMPSQSSQRNQMGVRAPTSRARIPSPITNRPPKP
jgi:hypothetical protein